MSIKDEVLKELEENRGRSFSGETLAEKLGVSRAAIWKAVKKLREEGYPIESATNKGYMLAEESDLLSEQGICMYLQPEHQNINLKIFKTVDSTNSEGKRLAVSGENENTVIVSNEQTQGRGRLGRNFYSPASDGIYMTFLLKPSFDLSKAVLITTAASVAVTRAIEKVCNVQCKIKWVNDIFIGSKKVCGILTEAISDFETGAVDYMAVGIGVNCHMPKEGYPEDISEIAGGLSGNDDCLHFSRNCLTAEIINEFMSIYADIENSDFIEEYKRKSLVLGREINVIKNYRGGQGKDSGKEQDSQDVSLALAIDIDNTGGLVVEYKDGRKETLNTGEISVRF